MAASNDLAIGVGIEIVPVVVATFLSGTRICRLSKWGMW